MKVVTWNLNSIRAREERLLSWLARHEPDVVCLQETKVTDEQFPDEVLREQGYHAAVHGQRTYNGVAILSREPIEDVRIGFDDGADDPQARCICGVVQGIRFISVYVPNGSTVESDKYVYKREWLDRLMPYLDKTHVPGTPLLISGDFNIAPDVADVAEPDEWRGTVLFNPDMTGVMTRLADWGLRDVVRMHKPDPGLYSWWDYRQLAFPRNQGLRIDHILATPDLAARSTSAGVDRDERKGSKPSDHAPVVAELDWP